MTLQTTNNSQVISKLLEAINDNKCVEFTYDNQESRRETQPHAMYRNKKSEKYIDCFQTCGHSTSKETSGWKQFNLDKITDLIIIPVTFETHVQFNPNSKRYNRLIKKVEKP